MDEALRVYGYGEPDAWIDSRCEVHLSVKSADGDTVTPKVAVELAAKLRIVIADIVKSGEAEVADQSVAVAVCLIASEVATIVTL